MKRLVSMRLPTLSVVLLLQLLNPPTSSYSVNFSRISPRRWIGLQTTASNDNDIVGGEKDTNERISSPNLFEKAVRNVSKNKNYKFGDLTKKAVTSTTKGVEGAVRTVTKNEDYKFGDLTKNVVSSSTGVLEGAVKSIIKKDDYKFGVSKSDLLQQLSLFLLYFHSFLQSFCGILSYLTLFAKNSGSDKGDNQAS